MSKNIKIAIGVVLVIIAGWLLLGHKTVLRGGSVSPTDNSATNFTEVTASNGMYIGAGGLLINSGDLIGVVTTLTGALTQGGGMRATSTVNSSETLLASDLATANVIDYTSNLSSVTLTLPASTTLTTFLPTAGQTRTIFVRNATTTSTINLTIAGGSGTIFKVASSTNQIGGGAGAQKIYGDTNGDNYARLDFLRKTNTDIDVMATFFRNN